MEFRPQSLIHRPWQTALRPGFIAALLAICLAGAPAGSWAQTPSSSTAPPSGTQSPQLVVEAGGHGGFVRRIDVAPTRGLVVTASDDKTARVWDLRSGQVHHVLRPATAGGEIGRLYGAAIHPVDDLVAVGGTTGHRPGSHRILLFTLSTGALAGTIDARGGDVKKLAWSADGSALIAVFAGDHAVRAFDRQGVLLHEEKLGGPAFGLAVSAGGEVAASALDGRIVRWTVRDRRVAVAAGFRSPQPEPVGLAFSPDGRRLAIAFRRPEQGAVVVDAGTGAAQLSLPAHRVVAGTQFTTAWSADGREIAVAGSGYTDQRRFPIVFHDAASGRETGRNNAAADSVYDLVALPGGGYAYASADGSWGVVDAAATRIRVQGSIADLRGPEHLTVSADGRQIGWMHAWGREPMRFDLTRRLAGPAAAQASATAPPLAAPRPVGPPSQWQDTLQPRLDGRPFRLDVSEVSRALTRMPTGSDMILGTSHRLLRVTASGEVRWQTRQSGEVRAVNTSSDGRMVVAALSDGTIRWWRAEDGAPLMSALATRDGRWVAWTPQGYFDAGAGADRLVGWSVNRDDAPVADHFSLNRLRERFNRPDLIDRVLQTATPVAELGTAAPPVAAAPAAAAPTPGAPPSAATAPAAPTAPIVSSTDAIRFPPVIGAVNLGALRPGAATLSIPLAVRADGAASIEVRVDGRPVTPVIEPPPAPPPTPSAATAPPASAPFAGTPVVASLPTPAPGSLVQVLARDRHGVSEPVSFIMQQPTPPASEPASEPASAPPSAPAGTPGGAPASTAPALQPTAAVEAPIVQVNQPAAAPPDPPPQTASPQPPRGLGPPPTASVAPLPPIANPRGGGPRLVVLAIGISEYQRPAYRLGLAAKDATDFAQAMQRQHGRLYRDVQVRTMTNQEATRLAVIANLKWLTDQVGPNDVGMLFMAGHGVNSPNGQYYFLPHDGDHEALERTGLPEAAIRDTLGRMRGKALFFVDTCFGGNAVGNFQTASRELARMANDLAAAENGVIVFASSSGRQLSEENDAWGNGAFTRALLAGLSGQADLTRTGRITFKGLDFYVSEEVNKLTEGRQTPVTIVPIGVPDFAIARVGT